MTVQGELTVLDPPRLAVAKDSAVDPAALLKLAVEKNVPPEMLEKLLALHERVMATNARVAFRDAMKNFQAACPVISKNRKADIKSKSTGVSFSYNFAPLDHIVCTVRPHLDANGLSYTFDAKMSQSEVTCTCTVHHVAGHSETATFTAPVDKEAVMNVMQKSASALTYARRYALIMALGISTGTEEDDDGQSAGRRGRSREGADPAIVARLEAATTKTQLTDIWRQLNKDQRTKHFAVFQDQTDRIAEGNNA